jgi:hypothetical protein
MLNKINIAEECHVAALKPVDVGGGAKSVYVNMKNWSHASVIVVSGVAANQATLKCYYSDDASGSNKTAIPFASYNAGATDVMGARTISTAASGFLQTAAACISVFEIDANQLADGYPYLGIITDTAAANIIGIVVVLSGGRYAGPASPTVIA